MRTAQDVFNESVTKIVAQGRPSRAEHENADGTIEVSCAYVSEGPFGTQGCAVGVLMDAETRRKVFEAGANSRNVGAIRGLLPPDLDAHYRLLCGLQKCHDYSADDLEPELWLHDFKDRARKLAAERSLTLPPVLR